MVKNLKGMPQFFSREREKGYFKVDLEGYNVKKKIMFLIPRQTLLRLAVSANWLHMHYLI